MSKRLITLLIILLISTTIGNAQREIPDEFPTLVALEQAVIPPRDRVQLAREILGITDIEPPPAIPETYEVGEIKTFLAHNTAANQIFEFEAELLAIGDHIYIWVDTRSGVTREAAENLAEDFDTHIYPGVRDLWGNEPNPGIDNDPRVFALFTYNLGGAAAYFSSENTYPDEVSPASNEHELFVYELDAVGEDIDEWYVESVTAHEFQHMIRDNVNPNPETWFNEGLSVFTEIYLGYPAEGWLIYAYLSNPGTQLNAWSETGDTAPHYAAGMMFVTYFYERYGLKALQTATRISTPGLLAIDSVLADLGEPDVNTLFADWVLANWWHDTDLGDGRYGYEVLPNLERPITNEIDDYPDEIDDRASQYSVDYYLLENLPESGELTIDFEAPATVQLVPTDISGMAWYSNRRDNSATTLTRAFDLTNVDSATLEYDLWYWLEDEWDYGYVMVSTDNGMTWELLVTDEMTDANPYGTAYGIGYTGRLRDWQRESISLDAYAGQEILLRFAVITDDATNQHGMVIDNVTLEELDYESDFDEDGGGWIAEGWVHIDNVLPQQVWVQVAQQNDDEFVVSRWLYPTDEDMTVDLLEDAETVMIAISPLALQTTVGTDYLLEVDVR